jgi:hypothetical protein
VSQKVLLLDFQRGGFFGKALYEIAELLGGERLAAGHGGR